MHYKRLPSTTQEINGRTVTGLCAIFGNVDLGGDRLIPGAFAKTLSERRHRIAHLWQHDTDNPPTAVILDVKEVGRDDLPPDVLAEYPETLGGLLVTRRYLDTPRADEILQGILSKAITGMSFGYDPVKGGTTYEKSAGRTVRNLHEVTLYEISDTILPMNPATRAAKSTDATDADPDDLDRTRSLLTRLDLAKHHLSLLS